jgi:hypothetical protein
MKWKNFCTLFFSGGGNVDVIYIYRTPILRRTGVNEVSVDVDVTLVINGLFSGMFLKQCYYFSF